MIIAGIGSRAIPYGKALKVRELARSLASGGSVIRSGGAKGADTAFEQGAMDAVYGTLDFEASDIAPSPETYWPWPGYLGHRPVSKDWPLLTCNERFPTLSKPTPQAAKLAESIWASREDRSKVPWKSVRLQVRSLMARTSHVILGEGLDRPADLVLYWAKDGKWKGGTAQGLWLAKACGIPVVFVEEIW